MKLSLAQLAEQADTPERTIRYYIQQGLLSAPEGQKRGAWYGSHHLADLLRIRQWREAGLSLDAIADLLRAKSESPIAPTRPGTLEVRSHFIVADGVEVVVSPDRARLTQTQLRQLFATIEHAWQQISQTPSVDTDDEE